MKIKIESFHLENIDYRTLKPLQGNLKDLPDKNFSKLKKSFEEKGLFVPLFVWKDGEENKLLDGHGREKLFQKEDVAFVGADGKETFEIPCLVIHATSLEDAKEKILIISSQYQAMTASGLKDFAKDLNLEWIVDTVAFDRINDPRTLNAYLKNEKETDKEQVSSQEEAISRPGDLFALGKHRLLCGSSTEEYAVKTFTEGIEFSICLTDPPYSVDYQNANKERVYQLKSTGDQAIYDRYKEDNNAAHVLKFIDLLPAPILIFTYPIDRHFFDLADALKRNDFVFFKNLVWVKDKFAFWPSAVYQQKHEMVLVCIKDSFKTGFFPENIFPLSGFEYIEDHEPIIIAVRKGQKIGGNVSPKQTTVLEFDRVSKSKFHPTQKPLDLWELLVRNHVPKDGFFFEPFAGSGTGFLAAESSFVTCYGIELSPVFCDKILQRWEEETGKKWELLKNIYDEKSS